MEIDQLTILQQDREAFFYWVNERNKIWKRRNEGFAKPWTDDPILQQYKFCNVERENDKVTIWIKENWREPYRGHENMWFAMIVARIFNWPPTLDLIKFPTCDKTNYSNWIQSIREDLKYRRDVLNEKIFTGAYLVSTNGISKDKIDYILDDILTPIWEKGSGPIDNDTLESYWKFLMQFDGLGSFMAGQVIADLKYIDPILEETKDWWSFAPLGPGSIRGLNRYFGRPLTTFISQEQGGKEINVLQDSVREKLNMSLPAHDIQNCLCEYDKYLRVKKGEGKPRSKYNGVV